MSAVNDPSPKLRPPAAPLAGLTRSLAAVFVFALVAWPLGACGGAEPRLSVTGGEAPDTLDGAEAELARLEASLDGAFGVVRPEVTGDASSPPPPEPPTAGLDHPSAMTKKDETGSRCENACNALASMGRSAERICQLAGPGDRCEAAKSRVASATTRVTAQCSECES